MKAIAVDDEPLALDVIITLADKIPFLELKATFTNAFKALDYLQKEDVDLIFLDIQMPDISGIEFYNSLNKKPLLIFTTAFPEYAAHGFELDATDYLLKPFSLARFIKSCNKAHQLYRSANIEIEDSTFFIKTGHEQVKTSYEDILYVEGTGNYVSFVLQDKKILSRTTFDELMTILPQDKFVRVHRSFIVNLDKITTVGKPYIYLEKIKIPVSQSYRPLLTEALKKN